VQTSLVCQLKDTRTLIRKVGQRKKVIATFESGEKMAVQGDLLGGVESPDTFFQASLV
jgi:hypothetical protein